MRTMSTADTAKWNARGGRATYLMVQVKDSGGFWQDLTTFAGVNLVDSARWGDTFDQVGASATIELKREVEQLSLSPLMTASPLNLGFVYGGTYAPLLDLKREVLIYTACIPTDAKPVPADWLLVFHGRIDSIDWGKTDTVELLCSDLQGDLRDIFVEKERVYAHADPTDPDATAGLRIWNSGTGLAGMTFAVGELGMPTDPSRNGHFYKATANAGSGNTGTIEPTWPTGSGATVVDGDITWTEKGTTSTTVGTAIETVLQQILNDNGLSAYTLQVPSSPGFMLRWFLQQRQSVWDGMKALVDQLGWDLRFKYNSGAGDFLLTLWSPDRSKSVSDFSFVVSDVFDLNSLKLEIQDVRNVCRVIYSNYSDLDPSGQPIREFAVSTNGSSVSQYGRRFMEIDEDATSYIRTLTDAQNFADRCVADLAQPYAEQEVPVDYFPFVELGDLYTFAADAVHYDVSVQLAVTGYQHSVDNQGQASTVLTTRGQKPSIGKDRWLAHDAATANEGTHQYSTNDTAGVTVNTSSVVGGTNVQAAPSAMDAKALGLGFEYHVSASSGFTPSSATLLKAGEGTQASAAHLLPGKTYYGRVAVREKNSRRLVRSNYGPEFSFVAGQASPGHLKDGVAWGDLPLNGGFEGRLDGSGMPDFWTLYAGALGTDVVVMEDGSGLSGSRYIRLATHSGGIRSAVFPIINEAVDSVNGGQYRMTWWRKAGSSNSAGSTYDVLVRLLDYAGSEVDILTVASGLACDDKKGHWSREEQYVQLRAGDSSARSAQLIIVGRAGSTFQLDVDEYRVQYLGTTWYEIGGGGNTDNYQSVPAFVNSWVNYNTSTDLKAAFRRCADGTCEIRGIIKSGTVSATAFTLPVGFRPPHTMRFACVSNAAFCEVDVAADGEVQVINGSNAWVDMSGIRFVTF